MLSRGEIHPVLSTVSRAERATMRAARELARRDAEQASARSDPDDGIVLSEAGLERLTGSHRTSYRKLDWRNLVAREPVALPVRMREREREARHALMTWQPNWHDRMFASEAQRRRQLAARVMEAAREDETAFQKVTRAAAAHNAETFMARGLQQLAPQAIKDAVTAKTRLAELREPMNGFGVSLPGGRRVVAVVEAIQEEDVPHERVLQSDSRIRRRAPIPPAERRRIHLAAVCSAGLRVGADLVALLPVNAIEVVVRCEPAGSSRAEPAPVLQMLVTAKSLTEQPWAQSDAISLATALRARLNWSIKTGFAPIQLVNLTPAQAAA